MIRRRALLLSGVLLFCLGFFMRVQAGFVAYNDCATNAAPVGNFTGVSPGTTNAFALISSSGAPSSVVAQWNTNEVAPGLVELVPIPYFMSPTCDAAVVFGPSGMSAENQFVMWKTNSIYLSFTNLLPTRRYTFVYYGTRNATASDAYYTNRIMAVTIQGAVSFTNAASSGAQVFTRAISNDSVRIVAGNNTNGTVARFTGIEPGPNAGITFRIYADGICGSPYAYANAFMLQEFDVPPAITVLAPSVWGPNAITASGNLTSTGGAPTQVWLCWQAGSDAGTNRSAWTNSVNMGIRTVGTVTTNMTGLPPSTPHYYRYYATNIAGSAWSAATNGTTLAAMGPAITNLPYTVLGPTSAVFAGNLTSTGGLPTSVWLCWQAGSDAGTNKFQWANGVPGGVRPVGAISNTIISLVSNTTYYYRYYASNAAGEAWAAPASSLTTSAKALSAADAFVIINEIMYAPDEPWPTNQPAKTTNDTEYVELYNGGTSRVDLTQYQFDNGISFDFPPGAGLAPSGYLVVCRNYVAFTNHYPGVTNVMGNFNGSLSDGGETVTLSMHLGDQWVTADQIAYIDGGPADGEGPSLELINNGFARFDDVYGGDWVSSTSTNGTPGSPNSVFNATPPPVVGDVKHDPAVPPPGSSITITARAGSFSINPLASMVLHYRKDTRPPNAWASVAMRDDGREGDVAARDEVYTVMLPEYENALFAAGDLLEFYMVASDGVRSTTAPAISMADKTNGAPSFLCGFVNDTYADCVFPGEYDTYHMLMTATNRAWLETYGTNQPYGTNNPEGGMAVDATFIGNNGDLFYNSGVRYRGGGSRSDYTPPALSYRVGLPRGRPYGGTRELILNQDAALDHYLGMKTMANVGYGCRASDVKLVRLWLNELNLTTQAEHRIYVRLDAIDNDLLKKSGYSEPFGNIYMSDGAYYQGDLRWFPTLDKYMYGGGHGYDGAEYSGEGYQAVTNNPYTCWPSMSNLCGYLNQDVSQFPSTLTNRVNVRQWARFFAANVAIDNGEAGISSPVWTYGDELRMYCDPADGRFVFLPWDMSDTFGSARAWVWNWKDYSGPVSRRSVSTFLFNKPILPYYLGDAVDIMETVLSQSNLTTMVDGIGSKGVSFKAMLLSSNAAQRVGILANINTSLTVRVNGLLYTGMPITVSSSTITLSGKAPQNYAGAVLVNGSSSGVSWDLASTNWSATLSGLQPLYNEATVDVIGVEGDIRARQTVKLVCATAARMAITSRTISTSATWSNAAGVISIETNVTISANTTVTIAPGMQVVFATTNSRILVGASATLDIRGSSNAPVCLYVGGGQVPGVAWSVTSSGALAVVTGNYVRTLGGRFIATNAGSIVLNSSTIGSYGQADGIIAGARTGRVSLSYCTVQDYARTIFSQGATLTTFKTLFRNMSAAGTEVAGGNLSATRTTWCQPMGTDAVDGIRSSTNAHVDVTNSMLCGFGGAGIEVMGTNNRVNLSRSLVYGCAKGVDAAAGSAVTNLNITIAACNVGLVGTQTVVNTIVWSNGVSYSNAHLTASYSDIEQAGTNIYAGVGNLNRTPWFRDPGENDYRLLSISPCTNAASDNGFIGAAFACGATPQSPSDLVLTNIAATQLQLKWLDNSSDESGFEVQRSTNGVSWTTLTNLPAASTNFMDTGLVENTTVYYRVRAGHDRGDSLLTDEPAATTVTGQTTQRLIDSLRITEIMYNPAGVDDGEFIELKNVGSQPLDLTGLYVDGSRYSFTNGTILTPGQFFLLVRNPVVFSELYPGLPYQGTYTNAEVSGLDNTGETVWIKDAAGSEIVSVTYQDVAPWPEGADGAGYSLVLVNETNSAPYDAARWRASTAPGGSPGSNDLAAAYAGIVINEVLSHQDTDIPGDWIELYNPGDTAVDISYWYLSDSALSLTSYQIPPGTTIPARGFSVFTEYDHFGTNVLGRTNGFALSEWGDSVYLSSGNAAGQITSYRTSVSFDASDRDVTFGLYARTDGETDLVSMSAPTMGATNAYPAVGPIVINEVMYNPGAGGKEYVEVYNNSANAISLYDGTNGWKFTGGISYQFPVGTVLPAGGYALAVSIDPAEFQAAFGLSNSPAQVFGPFSGGLGNKDDHVKLYKATQTEMDGFVPYVRADEVHYYDDVPWPVLADNGGASLERVNPFTVGNDATNWMAATLGGTPGTANNALGLPSVGFSDRQSYGAESNQTINVGVSLWPAVSDPVSLQYSVGGTATSGSDYTLPAGTLVFWPYETNKTISLAINDDLEAEVDETVAITIAQVSANARPGGNTLYTHTIIDHDGAAPASPVFSPAGSNVVFTNWIQLSMTCPVSGGVIYYTTDGTQPGIKDTLYTEPIVLTQSKRILARTFLGSSNASASATALFLAQTQEPGTFSRPCWLAVVTNGQGSASGGNVWLSSTAAANLQATPSNFYAFGGWAGDVGDFVTNATNSASVTFTVNSSRTIVANFPLLLATNQTPQLWLSQYYVTNNYDAAALSDTDGDRMKAWQEYVAGTDPTDPDSLLRVAQYAVSGSQGVSVVWSSVTGRVYAVERSTNLRGPAPFVEVARNIPANSFRTNSYSDPQPPATGAFYRIGVRLP